MSVSPQSANDLRFASVVCQVPQAALLAGDRPNGRWNHAARRQIMSRANCVQVGPRDIRDTTQGTEFSGGGRTNTDQAVCPKARRNAPDLPFGILARERS
jgi:hypothetical protein